MIIEPNTDEITLPESISPYGCELMIYSDGDPQFNPGSYLIVIHHYTLEDLLEMRLKKRARDIVGTPFAFAITHDKILLHPKTLQRFHAVFRYFPAMKEI